MLSLIGLIGAIVLWVRGVQPDEGPTELRIERRRMPEPPKGKTVKGYCAYSRGWEAAKANEPRLAPFDICNPFLVEQFECGWDDWTKGVYRELREKTRK